MLIEGKIFCFPVYNLHGLDEDYGLVLRDFDQASDYGRAWHHVSCGVDPTQQMIRGTLHRHDREERDFGYLKHEAEFLEQFSLTQGEDDSF